MKLVETHKHRDTAKESQRLLRSSGIDAKVVVDPLESMAPALSDMQDVAVVVSADRYQEAVGLLRGFKKAS